MIKNSLYESDGLFSIFSLRVHVADKQLLSVTHLRVVGIGEPQDKVRKYTKIPNYQMFNIQ